MSYIDIFGSCVASSQKYQETKYIQKNVFYATKYSQMDMDMIYGGWEHRGGTAQPAGGTAQPAGGTAQSTGGTAQPTESTTQEASGWLICDWFGWWSWLCWWIW